MSKIFICIYIASNRYTASGLHSRYAVSQNYIKTAILQLFDGSNAVYNSHEVENRSCDNSPYKMFITLKNKNLLCCLATNWVLRWELRGSAAGLSHTVIYPRRSIFPPNTICALYLRPRTFPAANCKRKQ